MSNVVLKTDLFVQLGYGASFDVLDGALDDAGLSRPGKNGISADKTEAVRDVLAERFLAVCSRGDCQAEVRVDSDGRTIVPASRPDECGICGGSANARAVDRMIATMHSARMSRLCVVGGSPGTRVELERLVAGRIEVRLIDGAIARTAQLAKADLAWADRVVLWGGTILAHKVSTLYRAPHVIQFARRSIQELARAVTRST